MVDLLKLAIQALDDPDAIPVLGDAILDTGWNDDRAWTTVIRLQPYRADPAFERRELDRWRLQIASRPTHQLAMAVAAVLLFGDWPTRWPLAEENARRQYSGQALRAYQEFEEEDMFRVTWRDYNVTLPRGHRVRILHGE